MCGGAWNYDRKVHGEAWDELSVFNAISIEALLVPPSNRIRGLERSQQESMN